MPAGAEDTGRTRVDFGFSPDPSDTGFGPGVKGVLKGCEAEVEVADGWSPSFRGLDAAAAAVFLETKEDENAHMDFAGRA